MEQKAIAGVPANRLRDGETASDALRLLGTLGPARILALGAVALVLFAFFGFVILRATEKPYTLLFSGLEIADAQELVGRLEAMGVAYRLTPAGDAIMVPADEALRLRMSLAEEGLPVGSTVGYELFDQTSPFATTDFLANVNLRRATEGELARTIGTLRAVRAARVHIVEPRRTLFGRDNVEPSASIVLSLKGPAAIDRRQVRAIQQLVAAAVPGLDPRSVTVVDDQGALLARASSDGDSLGMPDQEEHQAAFEARLQAKIVQLLERTVGVGGIEAVVTADLDFDTVATTAESFDPAGQVIRSTQTTEEASDLKENEPGDAVTVTNNLPTEQASDEPGAASSERSNRTEETVNYEISRTVQNQQKAVGTVRRLSVAVQVDGIYRDQPDGTRAYEPRTAEELEQLATLVRSAAGLDEERGDVVTIVNRPFASPPELTGPEPPLLGLAPADWWRMAELGTLAALSLAVLFFGVRPAIRRLLPERTPTAPAPTGTAVVMGPEGKPLLVHGATGATIGVDAGGNPVVVREPIASEAEGSLSPRRLDAASGDVPEMVDLKHIRGQVRASLVHDVAQVIATHPEDAIRVIRDWLHGG